MIWIRSPKQPSSKEFMYRFNTFVVRDGIKYEYIKTDKQSITGRTKSLKAFRYEQIDLSKNFKNIGNKFV